MRFLGQDFSPNESVDPSNPAVGRHAGRIRNAMSGGPENGEMVRWVDGEMASRSHCCGIRSKSRGRPLQMSCCLAMLRMVESSGSTGKAVGQLRVKTHIDEHCFVGSPSRSFFQGFFSARLSPHPHDFAFRETDRQTDSQAGRQADRHRQTQTDTDRQRQTETDRDRERERESGRRALPRARRRWRRSCRRTWGGIS